MSTGRLRFTGWAMVAVGVVVLVTTTLVPIPDFDRLTRRPGTLLEAVHEPFSPCRHGSDCARTLVTVRHPDGVRRYNFADADPGALDIGAPITVWTHPEFRGFDRLRAWHAEQHGRVIRDHAALARADRRIRLGLLALVPVLFVAGGWILRGRDE